MKIPILLALCVCAAPVWAQPDVVEKPRNGLPFRLIAPAEVEKLAIPKPIQLHLKNVTVAWALEELQGQSGVELDLENLEYSKKTLAKRISVDVESPSFNRAFDAIMDAAQLKARLQRYDQNRPWRVDFNNAYGYNDGTGDAPLAEQGLFAVRLTSLQTRLSKTVNLRVFKVPQRDEDNNLSVYLSLLPDPRLPLIGAPRPLLTRAEDDQGRSLLLPAADDNRGNRNAHSFYSRGDRQSQATLQTAPPAPDAKTLSHLEGMVVYSVVTKTETWTIPDLLSQPEWTREFKSGERTFSALIKAAPAEGQGANRIAFSFEVSSNEPTKSGEIPHPLFAAEPIIAALKIEDANGAPFRISGYNSSGTGVDGKFAFKTTISPNDPYGGQNKDKPLASPLKLTFEAPVEVAQVEVPFAFENVKLP